MNSLRKVAGCVVVGATLLVAGCSNPTPSGEGSASDGSSANSFAGQELTIMFTGSAQVSEKDYYLNTYIPKFEQKYGVKVNVDFEAQADGITKIGAEQSSGKIVSDVLYVDTANMAPYISGDWMEDISGPVSDAGVTLTTMYDDVMTKDGQRLFTPNSFDVYLTIANKKALPYLPDGLRP